MAWQQVEFAIAAPRTGLAEAALEAMGANAVTWAQAPGSDAVLEPAPGQTQLWDHVHGSALFEQSVDPVAVEAALVEALGQPPARLRWQALADQPWERAWLAHFQPQRFGEQLWVVPHGTPAPAAGAVNVFLDPGLAFGTGTHPTTALCLEALAAQPPVGQQVIDYGCGSGLLAIAALRLGADSVIAIDNDPQARLATQDNAQRNGVADRLTVADIDAPLPQADWVMANILAGILCELAPALLAALAVDGRLTLAGLLSEQAQSVRQAYTPGVQFGPAVAQDDWVRLDGRRIAL